MRIDSELLHSHRALTANTGITPSGIIVAIEMGRLGLPFAQHFGVGYSRAKLPVGRAEVRNSFFKAARVPSAGGALLSLGGLFPKRQVSSL